MSQREKNSNVFQEYRRIVLPDTQSNCFEGYGRGVDALMSSISKNEKVVTGDESAVWEICLVDWSRMFRVYLN